MSDNKLELGRYSVVHAGKALDDFLKRVTVTETRIGEYDYMDKNGGKTPDIICSGHILADHSDVSWIFTSIDTSLDANPKFKRAFDKNAVQILKSYYSEIDESDSSSEEAIDKLNKINKNKMLIIPFKPGINCTVDVELEEHKFTRDMQIEMIKWATDKNTAKLKCSILFKNPHVLGGKVYTLPIVEYLNKFRILNISMQGKASKSDTDIIKITDCGIFKPIQFNCGDSSVAIDGTYVYSITKGTTTIIGEWRNDDLIIETPLKNKAYKKLIQKKDTIMAHRRYMAPYNLFDAVEIQV